MNHSLTPAFAFSATQSACALLLCFVAFQTTAAAPSSETSAAHARRLPQVFHAAFCGDEHHALRDETGSQELSLAYSTAVLADLQFRERTEGRSTRDALEDMRAEYCAARGASK